MRRSLPVTFILVTISQLVSAGDTELPELKRTPLELYATAAEAYSKWKADPDKIKIIDVRSPEEFREVGFPTMAIKAPLSSSEEAFVTQVRQHAGPEETIFVICRSGHRSAAAVRMLARAGYRHAYTITDGFEGDKNQDRSSPDFGKRTVNGWKNSGLPWTK